MMAAWYSNVDEYAPADDVDLLGDLRPLGGGLASGLTAPVAAPSAEQVCETDLHEYDEDGWCSMCGRQRLLVARSADAETRGEVKQR